MLLPFLIAVTSDMNQCYIDQCSAEWLYPKSHCSVVASSKATTSRSTHRTSLPRHLIDFVFLIEYSQTTNLTYLDYFSSTLQSMVSSMRVWVHEPSDAKFTVVLYSLEHLSSVVNIIHSITSEHDWKEVVKRKISNHTNDTLHYSSKEMGYVAVDKSLQILSALLIGDELTDINGQSHSVFLRSNANIHVIAGLGLYNKISNQTYSNTVITERRNSIETSVELIIKHMQNNNNIVLHFFFSRDIHPAREFIGSSLYEVRYRDCTHLNKALTLKALLDVNHEANSLQAHLLALGRNINIMELSALTREDCVRAINPTMWNGFDLNMKHVDKCSSRFGDDKCGSDGSYCSSLHGCVTESTGISNNVSDDRVPLTGQIVTSHADLANTGSSSKSHTTQDKYTTVELSITRALHPTVPTLSLTDIVTGKPHTLTLTPNSNFVEKLIKKRKPVVVKNSIVSTWTAMKKWNFSYLENNMGMDTLSQVKCTDYNLTFDPDRTAPLKVGIPLPFTETNMSTSSFFSCIQQPSNCSDGLNGHYYFGSIPEPLRPDLNSTRLLFHTDRDYESNKQFMWISSSGMITHGHFDQDFNFFVQLIGKKRFTLWPSSQHELLHVYPRVHPLWHKSRINFRSPDLTNFPNFAKSRALQVVLEPGDVLYVPPYTWHYVETLSPSVSLSTWSHDYDLYHHMNAIYRHDHKFDLIQDSRGYSNTLFE